jgi:hypothetical protein
VLRRAKTSPAAMATTRKIARALRFSAQALPTAMDATATPAATPSVM